MIGGYFIKKEAVNFLADKSRGQGCLTEDEAIDLVNFYDENSLDLLKKRYDEDNSIAKALHILCYWTKSDMSNRAIKLDALDFFIDKAREKGRMKAWDALEAIESFSEFSLKFLKEKYDQDNEIVGVLKHYELMGGELTPHILEAISFLTDEAREENALRISDALRLVKNYPENYVKHLKKHYDSDPGIAQDYASLCSHKYRDEKQKIKFYNKLRAHRKLWQQTGEILLDTENGGPLYYRMQLKRLEKIYSAALCIQKSWKSYKQREREQVLTRHTRLLK